MTDKEFKLAIQKAIIDFSKSPVYQASINLFKTLGYNTERQNPLPHKSYDDFKDSFLGTDSPFNEEKSCVKEWKSIDLLFQLTADEVSSQRSLFNTRQVDNTIIETYLFFSIELTKAEYNRTQLAQITREINKVFPMPVLIVFKHGESITLSVINRRLNKKDAQKDVLEKVTVIKDISTTSPHRAHIEILFDLSFAELQRVHKFSNFVELHNAWQKTLDTKELNKRFYRDLSNWYFWALQEVHFPTTNWAADKSSLLQEADKVKEHNAKNLIRLLTRLLFVWFVKEKNLVPDELFDETYIKDNLLNGFEPIKKKGFDHKTLGSKYYRAILQNLFFATLNQTVGKREFRKDGQQMNVTNLMRYKNYFKDPQAFIKLVEDIVPFMNGGLFECLDSPDPVLKGKKGGDVIIYEDGFSDRNDNTLCVPDYIFFGTAEQADLSVELGDKKQKDVTVNGLINILKSYKFTVTENTPIEEDIALDPELLGRVFENLLASYNPETKTTARKQTGSFYTPREIVNYMVDESLKAYLKQKLENEAGMKPEDAEVGLEFLVGYNEKAHLFDDKQTAVLINAIDNCKILDPACGSGAFPMGILHKLVHILHKLDPNNKLWKERQIEKAQAIEDSEIRDKLIEDIETAFESNELDYGRKLYLIENCIYGVDIQPIATQISKLRFFISLIVDQKANKNKENFGIRPLPNLETKFVAANTLIGIEKPKQQASLFDNPKVQALEIKLKDIRHRLFSAKTPATKRKLREEDQRVREEMGTLLVQSGWGNESAHQLAAWDPYNQNVSSGWFDPEWMFGIEDGFDVVIGNPPYVDSESMVKHFPNLREMLSKQFKTTKGNWDLYIAFFEKAFDLLKPEGYSTYITPNKWLSAPYGTELRKFFYKVSQSIVSCAKIKVFEAGNTPIIFAFGKPNRNISILEYDENWLLHHKALMNKSYLSTDNWGLLLSENIDIINKVNAFPNRIKDMCSVENPFSTSEAYLLCDIVEESKNTKNSFRLITTGAIEPFEVLWGIKTTSYLKSKYEFPIVKRKSLEKLLPNRFIQQDCSKIAISGMRHFEAFFDYEGIYLSSKSTIIAKDFKNIKEGYYLVGLLNTKLISFIIKESYSSLGIDGGINFSKQMVDELPIPSLTVTNGIANLAQYLSWIKQITSNSGELNAIFNRLFETLNAITYELYFPVEISATNAEVLKHLTNLLELKDDWSDEKKMNTIKKVYQELSDPKHPVSIAMERQKTVKEVRIIEGLDK